MLCSFCGDSFLHAVSLRRHVQVRHSGEEGVLPAESHECERCGKVFKLREYLLQHLRSKSHGGQGHTAEKRRSRNKETETTSRASPSVTTATLGTEATITGQLVQADSISTTAPSLIRLGPESGSGCYNF
jgi:uncharacterized C2H2 Zn-finger protein